MTKKGTQKGTLYLFNVPLSPKCPKIELLLKTLVQVAERSPSLPIKNVVYFPITCE